MCLKINDPKTTASNTRKKVYKVLALTPDKRMINPYVYVSHDTEYFLNKPVVSDRESAEITEFEKAENEIEHGLHCFSTINEAKRELKEWGDSSNNRCINGKYVTCTFCICECKVSPKDHVADGKFEGKTSCVYHRITPIKML